jgi:hypothetical protein
MSDKIDKGRSILNAADEIANPYGLVLSEAERNFIYGALNTIDNRINSLVEGKMGWRPQMWAYFHTVLEIAVAGGVMLALRRFFDVRISATSTFFLIVCVLLLGKLNLLLAHEHIDDMFSRRDREGKKEAKERARYFKDMGTTDMGLDE